jgi:hypothetical protein
VVVIRKDLINSLSILPFTLPLRVLLTVKM